MTNQYPKLQPSILVLSVDGTYWFVTSIIARTFG